MNPYRKRILGTLATILDEIDGVATALDFGCGDGWFASQIDNRFPEITLTAVDVQRRRRTLFQPITLVPNDRLPFEDRQFDLSYAIDVLHHCNNPFDSLDELTRVTRRFLLLKDHTYHTTIGFAALAVLDEVGNRRFGIPSPLRYQKDDEWADHLRERGWVRRTHVNPCPCHVGPLGWLTNGMQWISLFERRH